MRRAAPAKPSPPSTKARLAGSGTGALAPVGSCGMQTADGEIKAARAAAAFGVPFTLSTMSICSIEDIAAHTKKPFWFQLYVMKDEEFVDSAIERARAAGCSALVLTLDLQIIGLAGAEIGVRSPGRGLSAQTHFF